MGGLEFLGRTAPEYGCFLVFDHIDFGTWESFSQGKAKWAPGMGFTHRKTTGWAPQLRKNFSVLYDLSSLIQNLRWSVNAGPSVKTERIGPAILSFAGNDSETRILSVSPSLATQIDPWMRVIGLKVFS